MRRRLFFVYQIVWCKGRWVLLYGTFWELACGLFKVWLVLGYLLCLSICIPWNSSCSLEDTEQYNCFFLASWDADPPGNFYGAVTQLYCHLL
jgi:hypothetical protein